MRRNPWTEEELRTLRRMWPLSPKQRVYREIPAHPPHSIDRKASELMLERRYHRNRIDRGVDPFFRKMRELREEMGIHRADLADKAGFHLAMFGRWERGESFPNWFKIRAWLDALGLDIKIVHKPALSKMAEKPNLLDKLRRKQNRA